MEKRENSLILETKVTNRSLFSWLSIAYEQALLNLFRVSIGLVMVELLSIGTKAVGPD